MKYKSWCETWQVPSSAFDNNNNFALKPEQSETCPIIWARMITIFLRSCVTVRQFLSKVNAATRTGRVAVLKRALFVVFSSPKSHGRTMAPPSRQDHIISDFCRSERRRCKKRAGKNAALRLRRRRQSYNWPNELAAKAAAAEAASPAARGGTLDGIFVPYFKRRQMQAH